MELKLKQKVVLSYFRTQLKVRAVVSPKRAAKWAFDLFCTPFSGKPKRKQPPLFKKAKYLTVNFENKRVRGFVFAPQGAATGKKVLIAHGFDSCCYKFERYITPLQAKGFEVYLFDAPGHGLSDGKTIHSLRYRNLMLQLHEQFGGFDAVIAHSLAGLATALSLEQLAVLPSKVVLIAPATEASTAVKHFTKWIPMPPVVLTAFHEHIKSLGGNAIEWYSVSRVLPDITTTNILWLHDEKDLVCPYADTAAIRAAQLPNLHFITTSGLGHNHIYRDNRVKKQIVAFVADEPLPFEDERFLHPPIENRKQDKP
jgi:pimeloyl-ACP methyl ester carboxylesterase